MFLHLLVLLLVLQIDPLQPAPIHSTVEFLPGFEGRLPFHLETGYVGVGKEEEKQLFYYFIKSESDPENDPLILWLTGGPGCSSFNGVVYEIGPLYYKQKKYNGSLPTLGVTPNSWTKVANIIFLEQPVNTGFSYGTTPEAMNVTDVDACRHIYEFLLKWLVDHPEFSSNNFYMAGDSYSGIIVPRVVQLISDGIEAGNKPLINLKITTFQIIGQMTLESKKLFMFERDCRHWARCRQMVLKPYTFTYMNIISYHVNHGSKGYRSLYTVVIMTWVYHFNLLKHGLNHLTIPLLTIGVNGLLMVKLLVTQDLIPIR
ncbi:Carboxypeptidase [Datura stramonium]|uniref:Carboxypeptidase n=1 Tax=Datura stramonium TaxID=4076 RepID=A0ABS8VBQ2_DATST|nr:Carboxypeptidase [Datura stramonium]